MRNETGYILLFLLVMLTLMVIAMGAVAPRLAQQIKRDRETEMIHRGEQYARAVKKYFKKFGRYPTRIEELESTNNLRFLRKRYTDPMSPDGNWHLVRFGEVQLGQTGGGLGSVTPSAQQPQSLFGGQAGSQQGSSFGQQGSSFGQQGSSFGQQGSFGQQQGSAQGSNPGGTGGERDEGRGGTSGQSSGGQSSGSGSSSGGLFGSSLTGQTFGGGPFLGVASVSEKTGIHEFNNKKKYNQWLFVYDPTQDRGGLIKGPYNPKAFMGAAQNIPGAQTPGQMQQQPGGFGNPISPQQPGGFGNPIQPQQQPQPQQPQPFNRNNQSPE